MIELGLGLGVQKHGTLTGAGFFKKSNCSYYFDEVNNYISLSDAAQSLIKGSNKQWSIRGLYKPLTGAANNVQLFTIWDGATNDRVLYVNGNQGGTGMKVFFSSDGAGTSGDWTSTGNNIKDAWNDFIVTYDAGTVVCYLNGAAFAGTSTTIPSTLYAGGSTADSLTGAINQGVAITGKSYINMISISSDVLTLTDAQNLWNDGSPKIASEVVANVVEEWIYDDDTFGGTNFTVLSNVGGTNGVTSGMDAVDKDCNENPY